MSNRETDISLIQKYLDGKLDARAMHLLERRAQGDPFLMDALEGYEKAGNKKLQSIKELSSRLKQRTAVKEKRLIPWRFMAAAASLIFVLGIGGVWLYLHQQPVQLKVASVKRMQMHPAPFPVKVGPLKDTVKTLAYNEPPVVNRAVTASDKIINDKRPVKKPALQADAIVQAPVAAPPAEKADTTPLNEQVVMGMQSRRKQDTSQTIMLAKTAPRKNQPAIKEEMLQTRVKDASINDMDALSPSSSYSINNFVQGRIISKDDGQPMPGVSVRIKGSSVGTQTDATGSFKLPAGNKDKTLVLGFIGYQTTEVPASKIDSVKTFAMVPSSNSLNEVVVTHNNYAPDETETVPVQTAHPAAGWGSFKKYLAKNMVSPDGKTGTVKVTFNVYPNGTLVNFKIVSSLSAAADQKALEIIKTGPGWTGSSDGKAEAVTLKIKFKQ